MKQINLRLYDIDELSETAQEKALDKYRTYNVDDFEWYEYELEDFKNLCAIVGIDIPENGISFNGFWSQGDGSTFASVIDTAQFINGIKGQAWKEYAPLLDFHFPACPCTERVLRLIRKNYIQCRLRTEKPKRGYWVQYQSDYDCYRDRQDYPNIEKELQTLDKWIKRCLIILNNYLYRTLEEQYSYETSDKVLLQTFRDSAQVFTADGKMADRLLKIATNSITQ